MAEAEKAYMQSPLVLWVETFKANDGHPLEYRDLYDGVFLNDVMQQMAHLFNATPRSCVNLATNWTLLELTGA
ncbi:hypothetical protein RRG08_048415 [Elysia crispata]|uniref:Uncharacterized protein n=1 Tax=Elysia crispata TaxID=231223 RepID=A0AAE1B963_9GAST|nr:hypothetical protein RRG08_048415 [Elysia crispata]